MLLKDAVQKIRSKNAGPFRISIDVFCGDAGGFAHVCNALQTDMVADKLNIRPEHMQRFEITSLHTIKFSFERNQPQGALFDRDMHGAQYAHLVGEVVIPAALPQSPESA